MALFRFVVLFFCALVSFLVYSISASEHGISLGLPLKEKNGFTSFSYVNAKAPKQGVLKQSMIGQFNSLNPFILNGQSAVGLSYLYDTLLFSSEDEPIAAYALVAKSLEVDKAYRWVRFNLDARARFSDGKPIRADDVAFSFDLLLKEGRPFYKHYYDGVSKVVINSPTQITFHFKNNKNKELPLILGQLPILPKHFWSQKSFSRSQKIVPVGSGPYEIADYDMGRFIHYRLRDDYWGKNLPVNLGRYNFKGLNFEYFLDSNVAFEAFKSLKLNFRQEYTAKLWATSYEGVYFKDGSLLKEEIVDTTPKGSQSFVFNLRQSKFQNLEVRKAIHLLFDFEWTNKNLFYGAYRRNVSYFQDSDFQGNTVLKPEVLTILKPFESDLPAHTLEGEISFPVNSGDGRIRDRYKQALALMAESGWNLKDGRLYNAQNELFEIEFLIHNKAFERIILPYIQHLSRIGISARIRLVDVSQYISLMNDFKFDMTVQRLGQSSYPGNEQMDFWSSDAAGLKGSRNLGGIANPVVDALVTKIVKAPDYQSLVFLTQALDRVLLANYYSVLLYYSPYERVAFAKEIKRPKRKPKYTLGLDTWWVE